MSNILLDIFTSIPIILILLYYLPILGIFVLIIRFISVRGKRRIITSPTLLMVGIILLIPLIFNKLGIDISFINNIYNDEIYEKLLGYSKLLIGISIIYIIISLLLTKLGKDLGNNLNDYFNKMVEKEAEISRENDLLMHEKRERAKNTHVVKCPYCGSDNMLTEQTGTCKFCRRKIEYK